MKCIFSLLARRQIVETIAFLDSVYCRDRSVREDQYVYETFSKLFTTAVDIVFSYYVETVVLAIAMAVALNIFSPEYIYVAPFQVPGVSLDTADGFALNTLWLFAMFSYGAVSYAFFDGLNIILVLHVLLLTNILCQKIQTIGKLVAQRRPSQMDTLGRIKNLIVLHNELRS